MPPLGLATVAAIVPEEYERQIVDLNVERLPHSLLERAELVLTRRRRHCGCRRTLPHELSRRD